MSNNFVDKPDEDGGECKKPKGEIKGGGPGALTLEMMQKATDMIAKKSFGAAVTITAEEIAAKKQAYLNKLTFADGTKPLHEGVVTLKDGTKVDVLTDPARDAAQDAEYQKAKQYYALKEQQALQNFQYLKGQQWTAPPVAGQGQAITYATSGNPAIYNNPLAAWTTAYDQWSGNSGLGSAGLVQPTSPATDPMPTPPKPAPESMEALYKGSCFDPESEKHLKFDGQVLLLGEEVEAKKSKTKAKSWAEAIAKVKKGIMGDLNMPSGYKAGVESNEPIKATQYYTDYKIGIDMATNIPKSMGVITDTEEPE